MDSENREKTDSNYTYTKMLKETNLEATNKLYILDTNYKLYHLAQKKELDELLEYETISEISLDTSTYPKLSEEIAKYEKIPFNRIAVADRVITINDRNFNLFNGDSWSWRQGV